MTLRIATNSDGTFQDDHATHTVTMFCDVCNASASVNVNTSASFIVSNSINVGISIPDSSVGGTCGSITFWPLTNGTADAQELALLKTA